MAQQNFNRGSFPGDPSAENIYSILGKVQENFDELYASFLQGGEFTESGTLVYPYGSAQIVTYDNGVITQMDTTYLGKDWTMTLTRVDGFLTRMESTDEILNWERDITYNADGTIAIDGGWVSWVP